MELGCANSTSTELLFAGLFEQVEIFFAGDARVHDFGQIGCEIVSISSQNCERKCKGKFQSQFRFAGQFSFRKALSVKQDLARTLHRINERFSVASRVNDERCYSRQKWMELPIGNRYG